MANLNPITILDVDLGRQAYPIYIGENILTSAHIPSLLSGRQVLIVTNETVASLYLKQFDYLQRSQAYHQFIIPDGEKAKNVDQWYAILDFMIKNRFHRDCTMIALGGGVVGDLTGFVAATFQRGVDLIQIPTTLLAQVDSSVGGKTAINHPAGKNLIGSFYQPKAVVIDIATLKSLPVREVRAGLAEVIKYGLLSSSDLLSNIIKLLEQTDFHLSNQMMQIIKQCCEIKAAVVKEDEREQGARALLNLGHTFAHAIEAYGQYKTHLHGEAVAIGLYCAAAISYLLGHLSLEKVKEIDNILKMANLPNRIAQDWSEQRLLDYMKQDKKIKNNQLRLILMKDFGQCFIDETVPEDVILQTWQLAKEGADA